jgi:hypothetical protein
MLWVYVGVHLVGDSDFDIAIVMVPFFVILGVGAFFWVKWRRS